MIKIFLVLVYIYGGELTVEQKAFPTEEACYAEGQKIIEKQQLDPKFDGGLFAACVPAKAQEV